MQSNNISTRVIKKVLRILCPILNDRFYLKTLFRLKFGYELNLSKPKSFNEKLQWLKLNDIHPEYTMLVDKVSAKQFVSEKIGIQHIIPTIKVWNNVEEIEWDSLPNQFVIKCSGDSGGVVVCRDKQSLDVNSAKSKLLKGWGENYYKYNKEYPYKGIKPRIIAEAYMEDESGYELKDYKFFCFNGEPKFLKVDFDRQTVHRANYYDMNWTLLPFYEKICPMDPERKFEKPENFSKMIEIARTLSSGIPFVRIDLYNISGRIYFGEITFFPASGLGVIEPAGWDQKIGEYLTLPNS